MHAIVLNDFSRGFRNNRRDDIALGAYIYASMLLREPTTSRYRKEIISSRPFCYTLRSICDEWRNNNSELHFRSDRRRATPPEQ